MESLVGVLGVWCRVTVQETLFLVWLLCMVIRIDGFSMVLFAVVMVYLDGWLGICDWYFGLYSRGCDFGVRLKDYSG